MFQRETTDVSPYDFTVKESDLKISLNKTTIVGSRPLTNKNAMRGSFNFCDSKSSFDESWTNDTKKLSGQMSQHILKVLQAFKSGLKIEAISLSKLIYNPHLLSIESDVSVKKQMR